MLVALVVWWEVCGSVVRAAGCLLVVDAVRRGRLLVDLCWRTLLLGALVRAGGLMLSGRVVWLRVLVLLCWGTGLTGADVEMFWVVRWVVRWACVGVSLTTVRQCGSGLVLDCFEGCGDDLRQHDPARPLP